ncbi:MAG: methyltransferase domain-containing protein [Lachnospiraceae bacterium]|nr:methyltransferase domain-containing protein [Lachnospiraceae bacterium]
MIDREQIGIRIAVLRKKAGLSQQALADKLGVSAQAVSKWEGGKNLPDIDMFRELAWLFHMTIDSIVEGDLLFAQKSVQKELPASIEALLPDAERRRLLQSLSTYCSDAELGGIARELSRGNLEMWVRAGITRLEGGTFQEEKKVSIPASLLGENTLRETAPYFAKTLGEMMGNMEPGLRRIQELMRCPDCGERLSSENRDDNTIYFKCKNNHCCDVTDGVIYFGSREIPGELWSLYMKNYQDYLREQRHPGNPRYQMGAVPCSELRWQTMKKLRPRIILDIACGTCNGLKYDLQRINWPCLVIMTDVSHRILKYNNRYFTEEMANPYVDIVCLACDCARLPIRDGCIDMVVSNGGFESMQSKMMDGFREAYRVLKPGGHAVYNISILGDHASENTKKWEHLYYSLNESYSLHEKLFDIREWEEICRDTGYAATQTREIYGELPAPQGDIFPFENEILQWMGEYLCVSEK